MRKNLLLILFFSSCLQLLQANPKVDQLKQRICNVLPTLEGWCSREKALNFVDLVLEVEPEVCVEIGVFGGSSLYPVATTLKWLGKGMVIGIDPWDKVECTRHFNAITQKNHLEWWSQVDMQYIYNSCLAMITKYKLEAHCLILKMPSKSAVAKIPSIDILYLDKNYDEKDLCIDVLTYLPKVRSGGYIWMNDTLWEQSQDAIELLLEQCDVIKLIDNGNCILFKKR